MVRFILAPTGTTPTQERRRTLPLDRSHPALGAFLPKRRRSRVDWEAIADDLAYGLRRRMEHLEPVNKRCQCQDHLSLYVYDDAKAHGS